MSTWSVAIYIQEIWTVNTSDENVYKVLEMWNHIKMMWNHIKMTNTNEQALGNKEIFKVKKMKTHNLVIT